MRYSIGVDLGGTNIRVGYVREDGIIEHVVKAATVRSASIEPLIQQIADLIDQLPTVDYPITGIGVGVPGPVRAQDGYVYVMPNLQLYDIPLKQLLEAKLGMSPVIVGNDANVAALAEAKSGAGKGYETVQFVTVSTGIGGGLVIGDKLITGSRGYAQEVGNMIVLPNGRRQSEVMNAGAWEAQCSGTALVAQAAELGVEVPHAGEVFVRSLANKELAHLVANWTNWMAVALANMVNLYEPDIFILGGGVMKSRDFFWKELVAAVDQRVFPGMRGQVKIVLAQYDQDAGLIGAGLLPFYS